MKYKICFLGAYNVGKSSLVQRYVNSIFYDRYLSTMGVWISEKKINLGKLELDLVIWDMEGELCSRGIDCHYLRDTDAFAVVAEGTKLSTIKTALALRLRAMERILPRSVPNFLILNKADLSNEWAMTEEMEKTLSSQGIDFLKTSAKEDYGVQDFFKLLSRKLLSRKLLEGNQP